MSPEHKYDMAFFLIKLQNKATTLLKKRLLRELIAKVVIFIIFLYFPNFKVFGKDKWNEKSRCLVTIQSTFTLFV